MSKQIARSHDEVSLGSRVVAEEAADATVVVTEGPPARHAAKPRPVKSQVEVDALGYYANFCRVTGRPEELTIDFGLNSQPMGVPVRPIAIAQRLVINFFTAKRMVTARRMSVERHEAAFGVLETDVQRRAVPSALRARAGSSR